MLSLLTKESAGLQAKNHQVGLTDCYDSKILKANCTNINSKVKSFKIQPPESKKLITQFIETHKALVI